jgi:hypothetical protein
MPFMTMWKNVIEPDRPQMTARTLEQATEAGGVKVWLYSFFNLGARWEWVVMATPRPLYPQEGDLAPHVQEDGRATGLVWTGAENLTRKPGFDPRTVQRVANCYTDYAVPVQALYMLDD